MSIYRMMSPGPQKKSVRDKWRASAVNGKRSATSNRNSGLRGRCAYQPYIIGTRYVAIRNIVPCDPFEPFLIARQSAQRKEEGEIIRLQILDLLHSADFPS